MKKYSILKKYLSLHNSVLEYENMRKTSNPYNVEIYSASSETLIQLHALH